MCAHCARNWPDGEPTRAVSLGRQGVVLPGGYALGIQAGLFCHWLRPYLVTVPVVWAIEMAVSRSENEFAVKLFRRLPRRYDLLAEILSFGQNRRWRAELVKHVVAGNPARLLGVAPGSAGVAMAMARQSSAHITGVDVSEDMLEIGRRRVLEAGLDGRIQLDLAPPLAV